jgi:MFS transporter, ceroid-lipofuscinosis neuronal protein 7
MDHFPASAVGSVSSDLTRNRRQDNEPDLLEYQRLDDALSTVAAPGEVTDLNGRLVYSAQNSSSFIRNRSSPLRDEQLHQSEPSLSSPYVDFLTVELTNVPHSQLGNHEDENDDGDRNNDDSSVETRDGIHDVPGFWCVCLVILIGDMSRGVFFPSLWPLVESLGGNKVLLGYAVAAFSLGRILVNPLFGSWSHTYGYSPTLLLSCGILLLGTLLYGQVQNIRGDGSRQLHYLIMVQTVLGVGSGTLGVTRAFVADVTARRNRTKYMGWITAVQYGGFTVTPAFGALFNILFQDREYRLFGSRYLRINMYTAPAYFMASIVFGTIVVLVLIFQDRQRVESAPSKGKKSLKRQTIDEAANRPVYFCRMFTDRFFLTVYDCCILGCMLLNIATKGSIASFETLGIAIAEEYFAMAASRAGIIIACCGVCGVVALLNLGMLEQRFTDVHIITGGMLVMIVGIASLIDDAKFKNPGWTYGLSMFLIYSVGYPIGHTAVIGLFSKSTLCL